MTGTPSVHGELRRVAAFDFDGTLARRDTLVPFLTRAAGPHRLGIALGAHGLSTLRRLACRDGDAGGLAGRSRDVLKSHALRQLRGARATDIEALAEAYAARLDRLIRPAMRERLEWHRREAHEIVIVSASLAVYLRPLSRRLGVDHVIGVELEVGDDGRLTGGMVGPNVRGEEKAVRLRRWLGDRPVELWAYGDSSGDEELLAMADHPVWVGKRGH